ncbi:hypothetical protein D3C84_1052400 [compost metagenome]
MGNMRNHGDGSRGGRDIGGGDQDNTRQGHVHQGQVVIADGSTVPFHSPTVVEHTLHHLIDLAVNVVFHQGHLRRDIERALLAVNDLVAQKVAGDPVSRK